MLPPPAPAPQWHRVEAQFLQERAEQPSVCASPPRALVDIVVPLFEPSPALQAAASDALIPTVVLENLGGERRRCSPPH
jgi:hypothetical protein